MPIKFTWIGHIIEPNKVVNDKPKNGNKMLNCKIDKPPQTIQKRVEPMKKVWLGYGVRFHQKYK
jgi:hypothetical protein